MRGLVISFLMFTAISLTVSPVLADGIPLTEGWSIVPSECAKGRPCLSLCDLAHTGQHIIQLLIALAIPIATIVILAGSFMIMTSGGSETRFAAGKNAITLAVIGVAVVFGAWIVINTIFVALARGGAAGTGAPSGVFPWPWNQIQCQ